MFEAMGGIRGMTAARLSPAPADAVSYGAGLSGVSMPAFLVGTVVGELPWAMAYVITGASMRNITMEQAQVDFRLLTVGIGIAFVLLTTSVYQHFQSDD